MNKLLSLQSHLKGQQYDKCIKEIFIKYYLNPEMLGINSAWEKWRSHREGDISESSKNLH